MSTTPSAEDQKKKLSRFSKKKAIITEKPNITASSQSFRSHSELWLLWPQDALDLV